MSVLNIANTNSPTVPLAVSAVSANVGLPLEINTFLLIKNIGDNNCWVCTGDVNITATASSGNNVCIPAGAIEVYRPGNTQDTHLAAVTASGATLLSISSCTGV